MAFGVIQRAPLHAQGHRGESPMEGVTRLLEDVRTGAPGARDRLFACIYEELSKLAHAKLAAAGPMTLLDAPALVHETYLRLTRRDGLPPGNSRMFFGYAASAMRSVIVDYVRQRASAKRGNGARAVTLVTRGLAPDEAPDPDLERLDEALSELERIDPRSAQVVEMRYFAGMSLDEVAEVLELSLATVKRDWLKARVFLYDALKD